MLKVRIIPCLDVDKGRVVKGINFLNLVDAGDPVECAKRYTEEGADELVFLDITASSDYRETMIETIRKVSEVTFIPFTVGGGIRTVSDMEKILKAGSDKVSINTSAVQNPSLITEGAKNFGSQCIVVAVDSRKVNGVDKVFTYGGRNETELEVVDWCKRVEDLGAGEILLTSWDRDGTKMGFDDDLLSRVTSSVKIPVIASGGGGKKEHFLSAVKKGGASALLAASVFHFGEIKIMELKKYLQDNGINVRMDV
ncbi:MAG TPA: imidazole glycerol phosphate synthase subunit HisF [Spirochaetota bacterium]|nr:imidazole glycerol phosphate synthase subunit HisF [Spirochaetota bacterium]HOL57200.1 imidazole glycerol phosphate synthase subunit HisF [Spirochaetota bacterium]HPP04837.1 imidazole glycerol phosphate synthase subunit HisF [Spirochaetota bacterium]